MSLHANFAGSSPWRNSGKGKHLRNSTMKLITSLDISWHLHKAPSCSFQPKKKKLAPSRKSAKRRRKSRDSEVNTAKRYQKISENRKHIKTLTVFEYVLRRLGLIHRPVRGWTKASTRLFCQARKKKISYISRDTFHTTHLLHQTTFTADNFYTNQLLHHTKYLLHQTPFIPDTF